MDRAKLAETEGHLKQLEKEMQLEMRAVREKYQKARQPYVKTKKALIREQNQSTWADFIQRHMQEIQKNAKEVIASKLFSDILHVHSSREGPLELPSLGKVERAYLVCNLHPSRGSYAPGQFVINFHADFKSGHTVCKNLKMATDIAPLDSAQQCCEYLDRWSAETKTGNIPTLGKVAKDKPILFPSSIILE